MFRNIFFHSVIFFLMILLPATITWTCNVPVFRFALERWPADPYEITVYYQNSLNPGQNHIVDELQRNSVEGTGGWNYRVRLIDLENPSHATLNQEFQKQDIEIPCIQLRYPPHLEIADIVDSCTLDRETVATLLDSPTRREVASRLLSGETAVWIFLESGDVDRDDTLLKTIQQTLTDLERTLSLPDLSDVTAADSIELDPSAPPLRIQFSMLRLARDNPQERSLINQLLHSEPDLNQYPNDPMLFPLFGRGRLLYALVGEGISPENIRESAEFVIGPCTCLIKDQYPGMDLLLPMNWEESLETNWVKDRSAPPPFGLADIASPTTVVDLSSATPDSSNLFTRNLLIGMIIIILLNCVFWLVHSRSRRS